MAQDTSNDVSWALLQVLVTRRVWRWWPGPFSVTVFGVVSSLMALVARVGHHMINSSGARDLHVGSRAPIVVIGC